MCSARPAPELTVRFARRAAPALIPALVLLVLVAAFGVRVWGIGWDGYAALHPDERHLFFISRAALDALVDPANAQLGVADWWFSPMSPLNPHLGDRSYVYGEAPLLTGILAAWMLGITDWFAFIPLARTLATLIDTGTVLCVFLAARQLASPMAALSAAVLYAAMPSALQLANFHTVDTWLSFATAAALVPLLALASRPSTGARATLLGLCAGAALGLAMASKVTGLVLLIPAAVAVGVAAHRFLGWRRAVWVSLAGLVAAFVVFRLANPFAFAGPGVWGLALSADWIDDFQGLADVTASPGFPPNWQWIAGYGPLRLARDLAVFGVGPVAVVLLLGLRRSALWPLGVVPLLVIATYVTLTAISTVSALRYASPALPALAILLAPVMQRLRPALVIPLLAVALWWGAGAVRLHDGQHPRITASHWLWQQPRGTVLTNETAWDDTLPTIVALEPGAPYRWPTHDDWFELQNLDITAPDTVEKAERIAAMLARTDLLILSSDRQWGVMPRLPDRFPMTAAHYAVLFSGQACFELVWAGDRGYPLPGLRLNDLWAQEPWRIYDHPLVHIYRRQPCYSEARYLEMLLRALNTPRP